MTWAFNPFTGTFDYDTAGLPHQHDHAVDLTNVTADEHHNRDHSIIGATHTGFPGGGTTFLRDDGTFATPTATATVSFLSVQKWV